MTEPSIRAIEEQEFADFARAASFHFGETVDDGDIRRYRRLAELERTLAVFDGSRIVATALTRSLRISLPGGEAPCGGLTAVGVRTSHRRRGILRALVARHLDDCADRGEPLSALYASEAPIYGRFGFGPAAPSLRLTLRRGAVRHDPDLLRAVELVEGVPAPAVLAPIYERTRTAVPGMLSRRDDEWTTLLELDAAEGDGAGAHVVALLPGRGFASYRLHPAWDGAVADGSVRLREMVAVDPDASAVLWQLLASVDLMRRVDAPLRPPDDPLPFLVDDASRVRAADGPALHLRLIDVPAALEARAYDVDVDLCLALSDPFRPANEGRWRLEAGRDGAACARTRREPDLTLDVAALATAFLGGVRLSTLARAGLVGDHGRGALRAFDRALATDPLPWNPRVF